MSGPELFERREVHKKGRNPVILGESPKRELSRKF